MLHWHRVYRLPVNSIRIFNAYGPRVRTTGAYGAVFGVFLRQKLAGKPFTVVGDGTQRRDFIYVTDVAAAFLAAAETRFHGRDVQSRRRQSAIDQPSGRTAGRRRSSMCRSGPASPIAPGPTSPRSQRDARLAAGGSVRGRRAAHDGATSSTGAMRRCGIPQSIARATEDLVPLSGQGQEPDRSRMIS